MLLLLQNTSENLKGLLLARENVANNNYLNCKFVNLLSVFHDTKTLEKPVIDTIIVVLYL